MHKTFKKVLSLLVSAVTMTSLLPTVNGQNYPYQLDFSASQKQDEYELSMVISKQDKEAGSGLAFIGLYGENQRLIQTFSTSVSATDKTAQKMTVTTNIPSGETVLEARAYVWDSYNGMQPIAEPVTVTKIPQTPTDPTDPSDPSDIPTDLPHLAFLSEIGIMSAGHEEQNLTRGEAAEIAVKILKHQRFAAALEDSANFADIDAGTALCGYVQYCVQNGYLAADGDTFRPDSAITYGDLIKMLVDLLGYKEYAEARGGWITGYLDVAEDLGILLDSAAMSAYVTRAEAAEMFYQSSLAPIAMVTGYYTENGVSYPLKSIMNGQGQNFESWLTKYHKIYYVEGYVCETSRTNAVSCDPDEVRFVIQYTQNYDNSNIVVSRNTNSSYIYPTAVMKIGKTNADQQLLIYSSALVQLDSDGSATLLSLTPSNKVTIKEFDMSLVDFEDYTWSHNGNYLRFYPFYPSADASKSTKYMLEKSLDDIHLFVNGVKVDSTSENFEKYIIDNTIGTVRLIDSYYASNTTNGYYDIIMVDYYGTARVDSVNAASKKIAFSIITPNIKGSLSLNTEENDDLNYRILLDGKQIDVADLQTNDILSIAFDVTANRDIPTSFSASTFFDIYVSRNVMTGKYTSRDDGQELIYIDQKGYRTVDNFTVICRDLKIGVSYTVYLDYFGRIFDYEESSDIDYSQYAIIEKYTKSSTDDFYRATLYHADGTMDSPMVDTTRVKRFNRDTNVDSALQSYVYQNGNSGEKNNVEKRMVKVQYSASTGNIIAIEPLIVNRFADCSTFRSSINAIGSIKLNNTSKIINAVSYAEHESYSAASINDLRVCDIRKLENGEEYTAYAYGDRFSDGTYPLVMITYATGSFGEIPEEPEEDPDTLTPQYGVIEKYTKSSIDDYYRASIYRLDGTTESLQVDTSIIRRFNDSNEVNDEILRTVYQGGTIGNDNKTDISGRFVEYKVSPTSGNMIALKVIPAAESVEKSLFVSSSKTIGTIKLNQNTKLINAAIYCDNARGYTSDLYTVSLDQLENQESYTAYAYGKKNADGTYPYLILTSATGALAIEPDDPEDDPTEIEAHYAVAEKLTKASIDDFYKISLFCDDGTERLLEVDPYRCSWNGEFGNAIIDNLKTFIYNDGVYSKNPLVNRIVKYKLSPITGKLISLESAIISMDLNWAAFDKATQTLRKTIYYDIKGEIQTFREIKLGKQTKILNGIDYSDSREYGGHPTASDLSIVTTDKLVDQLEYNVTAYGEPDSDGVYPYVILTGKEQYPSWTQIAVLTAAPSETADGTYSIKALYGHEEQTFITSDDVYYNINIDYFEKGDIVVFDFDENGNISEICRLLEARQIGLDDYAAVRQNAESSQTLLSITIPPNSYWTNEWSDRFDTIGTNMVHLVYGPIVDKTTNSFTLGTYRDGKTDLYTQITDSILSDSGRGGTMEFYLTDETRVYVYDYSQGNRNRLRIGTKADIMSSEIDRSAILDDTINWSRVSDDNSINYAFAKVVNGEATDVFVILSK